MTRRIAAGLALLCVALPAHGQSRADPEFLWESFLAPPPEARPMMRWWWFGPAVDEAEIDREIRAMKAGGFGGFEVQPVYPLSPDDPATGVRNRPWLSDDFLAALRHAARTAQAEGMRIDVTGGSGWPFGGPHVPVTQAAMNIRMVRVPVAAGATEFVVPALGPAEALVSARIGAKILAIDGLRAQVGASEVPREALLFVAGRTGQQVKRAAIGAEGYVLDHLDGAAVAHHLETVGERLLSAFAGIAPPYAFFSDSLESYGSSWTGDLPAQFARRRGYDLVPHLPALFLDTPESAAVRFDWARTLAELTGERYLSAIDAWTKRHGTRFRVQAYGTPPTFLSGNGRVALPEGEGANWREFTSTRWATSGAHLYGKPVVSSEAWTWLHSPSWAATPLDMKVEADRHFLQGVNQLVGHGWPYSPPGAGEPGWAFYAAAALSDRNPWYGAMPALTRYLQRASHLLRLGEPANAVAIYLPTEDVLAAMHPQAASVNDAIAHRLPHSLVTQVLDAGHGFDFVDAQAIAAPGFRHRVLVLPRLDRIDPEAYAAIERWTRKGGTLIAIDRLPNSAGGLRDEAARAAVRRLSQRMRATIVSEGDLGPALARAVPDVVLAAPDPTLGFVHRKLPEGDLYFVANTGNLPVQTRARFAGDRGTGAWWDAMTGKRWSAGTGDIAIELAPYETRFLMFGAAAPGSVARASASVRALTGAWRVQFPGRDERGLGSRRPWADDPDTRFFSGTATYRLRFDAAPAAGRCFALDFGVGVPRAEAAGGRSSRPVAAIDAPIRDAAIVRLNGQVVGTVFAPPYRLEIGKALRPGENLLEIQVSNTMLNRLAGRAPADFRLLTARYGERFQNQDQGKIAPQPSGLLGPVSLVEAEASDRPCGS
ncbi:glycosyl hydrolase [Sphingomonas sp. HF-S4]|uniref:Glycosyl hydrolase n=1 Tax=Sphingomonas agrestis TaxID=3080540 RepID=A0ABU3Y3A1_9SPHN|nr:glycosyl hydrolase [Sphingomonas sp. HF-S4]MDV3455756.1 glycosyl hydrolase [Sphingomonas sp. HF-S4]